MSKPSAFKKFLKGTPPKPKVTEPRTAQEINTSYTELAKILGDKYVRLEGTKKEIETILRSIDSLGAELNARNELDKKAKENNSVPVTPAGTEPASGAV